ncbi:hypothetical protein [Caballeronia sp. ATUFL_F2_KS9A]|uniref:DUF4376 domain-containing protein n=1 Tax=Caballeronia sp. ATUFL_F2_KS9A TaxID=2921777 RepID=UPI002027A1ED|nr:hypothetical protein [Caballeronia sp. ATUFL_F2_KS9A]
MSQKQAAYDASSNELVKPIIAFYDTVDSPAPDGASVIDITDDEWIFCISNQGTRGVKDGGLADMPPPSNAELLAAAQAAKVAELSAACKATIYAGFSSSALGELFSYPAKDTDQQNLASSVLASLMPGNAADWSTPFWCADASGQWEFRAHTAAQIQRVGQDGKAAILDAMARNAQLAAQVAAAESVDAVNAIAWS